MKYVKISILSRSMDAVYEYGKATGHSFWGDFAAALKKTYVDAAVDVQGRMRCLIFFPIPDDAPVRETVTSILQEMGQQPERFSVSVADMNAADITSLKNKNVDNVCEMPWFIDAEKQVLNAEAPDKGSQTQEQSKSEATTQATLSAEQNGQEKTTSPEQANAPIEPKQEQKTEETNDLKQEAERIGNLKSALLDVVHGQRHAVDEVVQAIFECDGFNRQDENRRGPLATFLFTGPSGVGKTYLATQCAQRLGRPYQVVDMSEFSNNLSNVRFNGEHGEAAIVTGFVRNNPKGVIIFDEIEKAHINTIYLFLQILDAGRLMDMHIKKEVSFKDTIIFITTNAGSSLYDDPTVVDLSHVSRRVILEALRTDRKPDSQEAYFPECITTRFSNGHVILFNHLEPYALMQIVRDEIKKQTDLFRTTYGVNVKYDPDMLSALVLYTSGGIADARSLRGEAKKMIVKELQDVIMQAYHFADSTLDSLKEIELVVDPSHSDEDVRRLFTRHDVARVPVFADEYVIEKIRPLLAGEETEYVFFSDLDAIKRSVRGLVDYVLIDPAAGCRPMDKTPNDLEDYDADGNDLFRYVKEYCPDVPVYFLDVRGRGDAAFGTLLAQGGRGVIALDPDAPEKAKEQIDILSFGALVNNATFRLGRSGKSLTYNCSQYSLDEAHAVVMFDRLSLAYTPSSTDSDVIAGGNDKNGVTFADVIGCREAKKELRTFCSFVADPRKMILEGKRIPKGVLLYGPPGTGKTMLAKAMANEAKAAFIPITATTLFGQYVGQSEKNVRDLFKRARKYAPSVIFIDEVDAIARRRTGSASTAHNEDTLNAFIAEMDGFVSDERRPVFILAATNYDISGEGPRVLDPAFVRRFDRKVYVDLPDTEERFAFLKASLARHGVDLGETHDQVLQNAADRSSGLSNADLANVVDIFLRSCEEKTPTGTALMDALDAFRFGEIREFDAETLRQTACHESGHALVCALLGEIPSFLTIVSRGNYGGFMEHSKDDKKLGFTFGELMNRVCVALAGRAAEIEVYGKEKGLNTGAVSDLDHARGVIQYAFGDLAMGDKLYMPGTDEDCEKRMQEQLERTVLLLRENRETLLKLTDLLVEKKSLNKAELEAFFRENPRKTSES